jgi:hypothetical protein
MRFMILKRVMVSIAFGLIFSLIGFLGLNTVDGVVYDLFGPVQYLIFRFVFPLLQIHDSDLSWVAGLFWMVIVPCLTWSGLLFLFMSVVAHFRRNETRAA